MDKSRRLPPLGAPSSPRPPPQTDSPYTSLPFFDPHSSHPQPHHHPPHNPLPHLTTTNPSHLFYPQTTATATTTTTNPLRSSHSSPPPLPVSTADAAISKPKKLHREVEQRRRMRMAEQIAELRQCVSDPNGGKTDKVSILQDAVSFVKTAKKTIHSLQLKLQAAESECARLVALLAKLQPNLLTHQSHPSNPSSLPHHQPHLQHLPPPPSASHCSTAAPSAQLLPSSGPRDPPLNFDTVVPHASFRDAVAVAAVPASIAPNSDLPSAPVVHHSVPWNPFPPAQQFSYAAASTAIAHPPAPLSHLPHPLSQPAHTSLPHLSSVPHSHQPVAPAHSVALYTSHKRSLSRETRPKPQQHQSLQHQPLHQQRHVHPSQQQISPQRPHSTSAQPPHLPHSAAVRPPADHPTVSNRKDPTHHS